MRRLIGWNDPVNATMIRAYLISEYIKKESYDVWMEIKISKIS